MDIKLEVVPLPVTDVDRAKASSPSSSGSPAMWITGRATTSGSCN